MSIQFLPYYVKRLSRPWPTILKLTGFLTVAAGLRAIFWLAGVRHLFQVPDQEPFLAIFFREPFVLTLALLVGWYISSLKYSPDRASEYTYLNSLPIQAKKICDRMIINDLLRYSWVLGLGAVVYVGLLGVSPASHLVRLSVLTALGFVLTILGNSAMQILASTRGWASGKYDYPSRNNPAFLILAIPGYGLLQLSLITMPSWVSGYGFWLSFGLLLIANFGVLGLVRKLFVRWQSTNSIFVAKKISTTRPGLTWGGASNIFGVFPKLNPLFVKNLAKLQREKSTTSFALTAGFVMLAYLVAMNNENIQDVVSVLLAIACLYSFLVGFRSISQFSTAEEPSVLIYSMPLKKSHFYFSGFVPSFAGLIFVAAAFAGLLLVSSGRAGLVGLFWLKSVLVGAAILLVACNYALAYYPAERQIQKKFVYWTLALIILTAALYPYRLLVVPIMFALPFLQLRKARLYKIV